MPAGNTTNCNIVTNCNATDGNTTACGGVGLDPSVFPLSTPPPSAQSFQFGAKAALIGQNAWTSVAHVTPGGPGMIRKIWFATATGPGNTPTSTNLFFAITFDGASTPQVGTMPANPTTAAGSSVAISVAQMFTPFYDGMQTTTFNTSSVFGYNSPSSPGNNYEGLYKGYISVDMPFATGFNIQFYDAAGSDMRYWFQVFYDVYPASYDITPLRYHLRPVSTQGVSPTPSFPQEYPLLSQQSPHGVFLKFLRWDYVGTGGNWWEGRFRVAAGGPGMTRPIDSTTDTVAATASAYSADAQLLWSSTGTEDFFLSSWNFGGDGYYSRDEAGYLYNSQGPGAQVGSGSSFAAYRVFGNASTLPPNAPANTPLVFSWAVGDVNGGSSGSGFWVATVGDYE